MTIDAVCASTIQETINLAYFTHLLPTLITVGSVFFLYSLRKTKDIAFWSYTAFALFFAIAMMVDLGLWVTQYAEPVVPLWNLLGISNILFALFAWLLWFVVSYNRRPPPWVLVLFSAAVLIQTVLIFTGNAVLGYDAENCEAIEGNLAVYFKFFVEFSVAATILISSLFFRKRGGQTSPIFPLGIVAFILLFSLSSIVASYTEIYELELYAFLLLPILLIPPVIELINRSSLLPTIQGSFAVVYVFLTTITFQVFVLRDRNEIIIDAIILCSAIILSILLIKNAYQQIHARREQERLTAELAVKTEQLAETNERQEGLIHFIGHEVKGFLTKDQGAFASLSDGDFGALPETLKPFVDRALEQSRDGVRSVTDILTASNQKKGTIAYTKASFDLGELVTEIIEKARPTAERKGLTLSFSKEGTGTPYTMNGDKEKIGDNVFRNIIENSINYTPSGTITASLKKEGSKFVFSIKDTGIGISDEDKKNLFTEGGHGKDSQKVNVHSTGYGLYIAKNIVEAHDGTIAAYSEGTNKGSTFIIELPA